ncbi:MAG TPA: hypothetical protein VKF82_00840 [Candidatus Eremiobacteraceae bacterium]|nr:hypothetical protein [Candidatus Eremiobacteraceae bacterium]
MNKLLIGAFTIAAMLATSPAGADQTPAASAAPSTMPAVEAMPAVHHLVYRFGWNTKATKEGNNTGTTTIDIVGVAKDGGLTVNATDSWWNAVQPKQSSTCEVYANGTVTCAKPPYALTILQAAILPLLGQNYFSALTSSLTSSWKQTYNIRATFAPGPGMGFAGQVYTWNCAYALTGKGTIPQQPPLVQIQSDGTLKQQGGRYTTIDQKAGILFDPRIKMPVYVSEVLRVIPQQSINSYTIEMKLIRT